MANIKFSAFTTEANIANFDDIVGYQGTTMKKITPAALASSLISLSGGPYLPLIGGNIAPTALPSSFDGTLNITTNQTYTGPINTKYDGLYIRKTSSGNTPMPALSVSTPSAITGATSSIFMGSGVDFSDQAIKLEYKRNSNFDALSIYVKGQGTYRENARFGNISSSVPQVYFPGTIEVNMQLKDSSGSGGSSGQVLSSTGSGTSWINNNAYPFLIDTDSLYSGFVPTGLSGNPQDNTTLGINAGASLTSGDSNTLIGANAGDSITTGTNSVAIGHGSHANVSTGGNNTIVGKRAYNSGTASNNVYVGAEAGVNANTGIYQIGIGVSAGNSNTGSNSIAIGWFANRNNTASGTIAIGHQAGYSQTSATKNTNLGYQAGYSNTVNTGNVTVGYEAGYSAIGAQNTFIGSESGKRNIRNGAASNTALGYYALRGAASSQARECTAIGSGAASNVTGAYDSIFIGKGAASSFTSGGNVIVIGYNAQASSATATNEITLGNASNNLLRIPGLGSTDGHVLTYSSASGGIVLAAAGGGGASDLNGLSDCLVDTASLYVGEVPSGLSGNPQNNTILGIDAGAALTTGTDNTFIGHQAGDSYTTGIDSVMIGNKAGQATNGAQNVFIGNQAGENSTGGMHIAIGHRASSSGGTLGVVIGREAGLSNTGDSGVIIGAAAGRNNAAHQHISIGYQAGYSQTTGTTNTNIGYQAGYSNTTNNQRTMIGYQAGEFNTGANNTFVGFDCGVGTSGSATGEQNTALGVRALLNHTNCNYNTALGYGAGSNIRTGSGNTIVGRQAGTAINTGTNNTCYGYSANVSGSSAQNQIVIGQGATGTANNQITLGDANITSLRIPGLQSGASDGDVLTFSSGTGLITLQAAGGGGASDLNGLSDVSVDLANDSAYFINIPSGLSGATGNLVIGESAGNALTSGDSNVAIGFEALKSETNGQDIVAIGYRALQSANGATFTRTVAIGKDAGKSVTNSGGNVFVGAECMPVGNGGNNVIIGQRAAYAAAKSNSVVIGKEASSASIGGGSEVIIGYQAGRSNANSGHVSIGYQAGYSQTTGASNTNIGYFSGYSTTTQINNSYCGYRAGQRIQGDDNAAFGYEAMRGNATNANASDNVAIGYRSLYKIDGTAIPSVLGRNNTSIGHSAGQNLTGGYSNTFVGKEAGSIIDLGSNVTCIGHQADASSAGINNEITLGNTSVTTLRCQVTSITAISDRRDKTNIEDSNYGLELIEKLKPVTFDWNTRDGSKVGVKDLGFIAQELQTVDDDYLNLVYDSNPEKLEATYGRLIPVLVKAIQDLSAKVKALENA